MTYLLHHPIIIAAMIPAIVSIALVAWNHKYHTKTSNNAQVIEIQKEILKQLNGKKDADECKLEMENTETAIALKRSGVDCAEFRGRIGNESQEHYNSNRKVERALSFLVTKAGGTPADLDLG